METRFCPECQEECRTDQTECRECGFPLELIVSDDGFTCRISGSQIERWQRISTLMRRNGIRIENRKVLWSTDQTWWALPVSGLVIFILSLIYGPTLVNRIWEPPIINRVVALGPGSGASGDSPQTENEAGDADLLVEALSVSKAQKELNEKLNIDPETFVDKVKIPFDTINRLGQQALLDVRVRNRVRGGLLLNEKGLFLVEADLIQDAFVTESINVQESGALVRKTVFVAPMANFPDKELIASELVDEHGPTGLALLQAPINARSDYPINYDDEPAPGEKLWVFRHTRGEYFPETTTTVDTYNNSGNVLFHVVDLTLGEQDSSAPVFNEYGELIGIYLRRNDRNLVLSMKTFRERAPILFKHLR